MKFIETKIQGAFVITPERLEDERGFFARVWDPEEFKAHGLNPKLAQCSISFNKQKGTLRGMHYQAAPHAENKIVRCTMGSMFDVVLDLRPPSATFKQWFSVELTAENRLMLYLPEGVAHGFQTLSDNTEVFYQISEFFHPQSSKGVRWDDPAFGIKWPLPVTEISPRDYAFGGWKP
ncbi:MAG: dTDP-4-dehydrorhamnose 3,5-epimerase [Syntrophales bacterium LBB04]|nr:dTDP-4-dehydrorhamnose 3,5-epimerase [Syntrophales bacterium LBB04]